MRAAEKNDTFPTHLAHVAQTHLARQAREPELVTASDDPSLLRGRCRSRRRRRRHRRQRRRRAHPCCSVVVVVVVVVGVVVVVVVVVVFCCF